MSAIDQYKHECIGVVYCPSSYDLVDGREHRNVYLYRLSQDISNEETDFDGKCGDIIVGGGSGESAALRISIPEAIYFFTNEEWDKFEQLSDISKAFWTPNDSYVFCDGYRKLGWEPNELIELWITKHIVAFLLHNHKEGYERFAGADNLQEYGAICRLPDESEYDIGSIK